MILNKEFLNDIRYKKIIEKIAISNLKEEIEMKKSRNKKIVYGILSTCALFIICGVITITNIPSKELANINTTKNDNIHTDSSNFIETDIQDTEKNIFSIAEITEKIDSDKIIYETSDEMENACFAYEPNIENLYKNADVVLIGTFDSNLNMYTDGFLIRTETKFNTSKVLKNETDISVNESVVFERIGGVMTLDKFMENNDEIREDEFINIPENERSEYYIVQEYAPDNRLDFSNADKDTKYVIFLNYNSDKLTLNSMYYGIREINSDSQVYDYDTNTFIDSDLIK